MNGDQNHRDWIELVQGESSCRLYLEGVPGSGHGRTASIGDLNWKDRSEGEMLLERCHGLAMERGVEFLLAPMNRNTWNSYRLVTESDGTPPFFLENQNPEFYNQVFLEAGYHVVAEYASGKNDRLQELELPAVEEKYGALLEPGDLVVRSLNLERFEEDLLLIFKVSLQAFAANAFYTPISPEDFLALYRPILPYLKPEFVLIAERSRGQLSDPVGFAFAIPDFSQGKNPETLILKTYASLEKGVGGLLAHLIHGKAKESGYLRMIYALMHEDNLSLKHSQNYGQVFRKYALYGKALP